MIVIVDIKIAKPATYYTCVCELVGIHDTNH